MTKKTSAFFIAAGDKLRKIDPLRTRQLDTMDGEDGASLRKRFAADGLSGFQEREIVELLLTYCISKRKFKSQAKALMEKFGSLTSIIDTECNFIEEIENIGVRAPVFFSLLRSLAAIYLEERTVSRKGSRESVIDDWARIWVLRLGDEAVEHIEMAFLNKRHRPQENAIERLSSGYSMSVPVIPREMLLTVMRRKCAAVIICHNHPNGSLKPSAQDERFTRAIVAHLQLFGVQLIDHIIIGKNKAFSIGEHRELRIDVPDDELFCERPCDDAPKRKRQQRKKKNDPES